MEAKASLKDQKFQRKNALDLYLQADAAYKEAGDSQSRARVLDRLAVYEDEQEHFESATKFYETALQNYMLAGDQLGAARVRKAMSRIAAFFTPWGYLLDLHTGQTYSLKGDEMEIGRAVPNAHVKADVSFKNRFISRHHLMIRRDFSVEDLRSRNGTTINGTLLPYGLGSILKDKDIITLANVQALQFRTTVSEKISNVPDRTWAILINNRDMTYEYLSKPEYSLTLKKDVLELNEGFAEGALSKLRWTNTAEMFEVGDDWVVIFTAKVTDYEYKTYPFGKTDKWVEVPTLPLQFVKLSSDGARILEEGPSFQIILLEPPKPNAS